ncbi:MAG: nucleoside triphosphate pyrophosphatase [Candidatus Aegiribacteria sp.]
MNPMWWYPSPVPLVLASRSPRRKAILKMAGIPFVQIPGDVHETEMSGRPEDVVLHWAREKARSVSGFADGRPVLGADTMVYLEGELLGKPRDRDHAVRMLSRLSGAWHSVIGGVTVLWPERDLELTFTEMTGVKFRTLSPEEIDAYVSTGEPMDKAGSYGIQGYGSMLVAGIRGCYFNVMGLPVSRLVHEFRSSLTDG